VWFDQILSGVLKFTFSNKATKFDEIFTVNFTLTVKILSIFVAFLENMNFKYYTLCLACELNTVQILVLMFVTLLFDGFFIPKCDYYFKFA
jgi:hypothetical protein